MVYLRHWQIRTNLRSLAGVVGFPLPLLALLVAVLVSPLARGETLLETYQLAYRNDSKFRAAQADSRASGTAIDQARAGYLPTVTFGIEKISTRQKILSSNNAVFGTGDTTFPTDSKTLSITQPVFRKDVIERFTQAQAVVRQAGLTLLASEQELLLRTTAAYLSVLAATDSIPVATSSVTPGFEAGDKTVKATWSMATGWPFNLSLRSAFTRFWPPAVPETVPALSLIAAIGAAFTTTVTELSAQLAGFSRSQI